MSHDYNQYIQFHDGTFWTLEHSRTYQFNLAAVSLVWSGPVEW